VTPEDFAATRGFVLDGFQSSAMASVDAGRSVLVAAPTGSGKTLVAEYAVARVYRDGGKAFYTTPLKALSNQKFGDFVRAYGQEAVGLLTGDVSINADAPIVVMTTEVLRNMIYESSPALSGLRCVILDEVHYLQNPYRGGVWEEVIVHAPPAVSLVCLSATVSNAEELGEWLRTVRGATDVVIEEKRPVKLKNLYLVADRYSGEMHWVDMLRDGRPNPEGRRFDSNDIANVHRSRGGLTRRSRGRYVSPRRLDVVEELRQRGMLPAIYFIFSRDGCDRAVSTFLEAGIRLTSPEERRAIRQIAEAKTEALADQDLVTLGYGRWLAALEAGFAAHHAGMVPTFREVVEWCFASALIKVVFATETLSLGVNMPARSVVIEKLTKFSGERMAPLTPGEYTQLTGRAGRRGLDAIGYGVVLWSPVRSFDSVAALASRRTYELTSSFRPTYNMVANLAGSVERMEAHRLLNLSFGQFQADAEVVHLEAEALKAFECGDLGRARELEKKVRSRDENIARAFEAVASLLEEAGYLNGWQLTDRGRRLARIYHESDLLVAQAIEVGLLGGLAPTELAAVLSAVSFEWRGRRLDGTRGRLREPSREVAERIEALEALAAQIMAAESLRKLSLTRAPEPALASALERWASGASLAEVVRTGGIAPGDFVRSAKQLADLLGQVAEVAPAQGVREAAGRAVELVVRGAVAVSSIPLEGGVLAPKETEPLVQGLQAGGR
jgi:ATP-dependent RNA helicase HelY